ncbi:hypothetical protein LJC71_01235 [Desulfosarcina sp. OttesenSCG-928-A07]|nr:hypothetical protein [Desulfosarcina sp. OttesenSCG-928-G17]MDL2328365.1 hypothetical protein [Desulfosarcina sp. OttesenSCG-928-A07]
MDRKTGRPGFLNTASFLEKLKKHVYLNPIQGFSYPPLPIMAIQTPKPTWVGRTTIAWQGFLFQEEEKFTVDDSFWCGPVLYRLIPGDPCSGSEYPASGCFSYLFGYNLIFPIIGFFPSLHPPSGQERLANA